MDYLTRRLKINNYQDMTYPVYTKDEANEKQIIYNIFHDYYQFH